MEVHALSLEDLSSRLESLVKLESHPVAVKLVRSEGEVEGFKTPSSMGVKLAVCQAIAMAWRYGWKVALRAEECACSVAKVVFGWSQVELEAFAHSFLKAGFFKDMCAAVRASKEAFEQCVLKPNSCLGVATAPLPKAPWRPDVVLVFCNPAQAQLLSLGYSYANGDSVEVKYSGKHSSCGYGVVRTYLSRKPTLAPPGGGDKVFAGCDSNHLIFSTPLENFKDIVEGVEAVVKAGVIRYPTPLFLRFEPQLPGAFKELEAPQAASSRAESSVKDEA
ncbi:MAG: hypothetical protein DRJ97_03170 [Thermoprotei archaeon]|nr:MAG: hypothetical protein DRJ97_03170 [Thermoprotei archaeon]